MSISNLSAFEENILRAFWDSTPPMGGRKKEECIDEMSVKIYEMLLSRGQMPDQLRVDYIKKVLEHFVKENIIGKSR